MTMDRKDFIRHCINCGYCSRKTAEEYAKHKEEFSMSDIVAVYNKNKVTK
ncbi:hypothetical protein [Clostridium tertium]|nr:hypothetical protein [Clostridium tertium]